MGHQHTMAKAEKLFPYLIIFHKYPTSNFNNMLQKLQTKFRFNFCLNHLFLFNFELN